MPTLIRQLRELWVGLGNAARSGKTDEDGASYRVAATVADFVIILQLYLVKTHPRPTPPAFQQGN